MSLNAREIPLETAQVNDDSFYNITRLYVLLYTFM